MKLLIVGLLTLLYVAYCQNVNIQNDDIQDLGRQPQLAAIVATWIIVIYPARSRVGIITNY